MEKKTILNIMVDLETASTRENAAILSWAMVPFHTDGTEFTDTEDFHRVVSLTSCFMAGMHIDGDTQRWWMEQEPEARGMFLHAEDANINGVAWDAYTWLSGLAEKYDLYIWSRGLDFDLPKIEWCFRRFVERPLPYKYSHKMDVRTVLKFMEVDRSQFEMRGTKHNALDDCRHDIRMIREAYRRAREQKEEWLDAHPVSYLDAGKPEIARLLAQKEGRVELPDIGKTLNCYFAVDEAATLYRGDLVVIDSTLREQKAEILRLSQEVGKLKQEVKDLQAMG